MRFNKEEIALCKKIAEKYRKVIEYGDWYFTKGKARNEADSDYLVQPYFPLWQISDCLEFLKEKKWRLLDLVNDMFIGKKYSYHIRILDENYEKAHIFSKETVLEALLKAVLIIVEKEKS